MRAADSQAAVREDGLASYPDPESVLRHDLSCVVPASNSTMCRCLYSLLNVFREIVYDRHNEMRHNEM